MKKLMLFLIICILSPFMSFSDVVDEYVFSMRLKVPRVYDNMQSQGYRKMQFQVINGVMRVVFPDNGEDGAYVEFGTLTNRQWKLSNGSRVTYNAFTWSTRYNCIGSNKTGKFKTAVANFDMSADPSYAIWEEPSDDNSLELRLSGGATLVKKNGYLKPRFFVGSVAGTLGCGCTAYGHLSPTRRLWWYGPMTDPAYSDDVSATYGTWRATYRRTYTRAPAVE